MINNLKSNLMTINQAKEDDTGASHIHRGNYERYLQSLNSTVLLLIQYMQHRSDMVSTTGSQSEVSRVWRNKTSAAEAEVYGILISVNKGCRHI